MPGLRIVASAGPPVRLKRSQMPADLGEAMARSFCWQPAERPSAFSIGSVETESTLGDSLGGGYAV
jgi:hypothetical protein